MSDVGEVIDEGSGEDLRVKISKENIPPLLVALRIIVIIPILLLSLLLYLLGLILTVTVVGAIIGIPMIVFTYALDLLALTILFNPKATIIKVACPGCGKGHLMAYSSTTFYSCKRCKGVVTLHE